MESDKLYYTDLIADGPDVLRKTIDDIKVSGKKLAALYGNCHMEVLDLYLREAPEFMERYYIIVLPVIFEMKSAGITALDEYFLNSIDLLIYQNIGEDNKFGPQWATDKVILSHSADCKRICVPNTVFLGYFPQEGARHNTIIKNQINCVPMFCGDKYIDKEYAKTRSIRKTISNLKDTDHTMRKDLEKNLKMSFRLLEMQDMGCDVQMRDFVISKYKDVCLFTEPKHPTNYFFHEMADRILSILGMDKLKDTLELDKQDGLSTINRLFYPAVVKGLGLTFDVREYYIDKRLTRQKFSFDEFIEVYIRNTCDME